MRRLILPASLILLAGCGGGQESREMSAEEVAAELRNVAVEPGLWERTVSIVEATGEGLPRELRDQMLSRSETRRHCITAEQAARPDANFLNAQENSDCVYRDFAMREGRLAGSMTCTRPGTPGEMHTSMEGSYGATAYDMRLTMESRGAPGGTDTVIVARNQGRRIGDCEGGNP